MRVFVRAFPRSRVQWLDVLARSARSASAPRRGRKTGPHAAKHTAAKERANARTRERGSRQGNARDSNRSLLSALARSAARPPSCHGSLSVRPALARSAGEGLEVVAPDGLLDKPEPLVDRQHAAVIRFVLGQHPPVAVLLRKVERVHLERECDAAPPVLPPHARQPRAQLVSRWRTPQLAGAHELIAG